MTERTYGSERFIARTRNPTLAPPPRKLVRTPKREGDVIIGGVPENTPS